MVEAGRRDSIEKVASRAEYSTTVHRSFLAQQERGAREDMSMFLKHHRQGFTTINRLQEAMATLNIDPYQFVIWDHQRCFWTPMSSFQATTSQDGIRLERMDGRKVLAQHTFDGEASLVDHVVDHLSSPTAPNQ